MNERSNDSFESATAAGLKGLGEVDPALIGRLEDTVAGLPDRRRARASHLPSAAALLRVAVLVAVVAVVGAGVRMVVTGPAGPTGPAGSTPPPAPTIGPSASRPASLGTTPSPAPSVALSPARFASDPRMLACEQWGRRSLADVLYAFELAHGKDYRANLEIPVEPDLAGAEQPALVVVFKTGDSTYSIGGDPPLEFSPPPGSRSVCVGLTGVETPVYIRNLDGSRIVPAPAASPSGPIAGIFARPSGQLAAMTWDASRNCVWIVSWNTGPTGELMRVGPDGSTHTWPLPSGPGLQPLPKIQGGLIVQPMPSAWYGWDSTDVVVDGQGKVWIAAGYGLVRFDPATGKSGLRTFAERDGTQVYLNGGHWISAIAADGGGVLIARNGEPALIGVDESLANAATVTLPSTWKGATGLTVLGDRILVGGPAAVGIFNRSGGLLGRAGVAVQFNSLRPIDSNRAAVLQPIGGGRATLLDASGNLLGTVTLPMEPISTNPADGRLTIATDWAGHVWYGGWNDSRPVYVVAAPLVLPR